MARYEKDFDASGARPVSGRQLRALLDPPEGEPSVRAGAVACFLAGAEGWEQAVKQLGGAFSECRPRLIEDQSE